MLLIADCGSTKTDWAFIFPETEPVYEQTIGFNPLLLSASKITSTLVTNKKIQEQSTNVRHLFFYGAGCGSEHEQIKIKGVLQKIFPQATIKVFSDILGSARALAKADPGIICILGTGSNSVFYNGENISPIRPSLGYLLGDEGSGNYFGKQLLRSYFYNEMPVHLRNAFHQTFNLNQETFVQELYQHERPNQFLASFSTFLSAHRTEQWTQELLLSGWREFIQKHIMVHPESSHVPIHFTGSMAYFFESELKATLKEFNLEPGIILQKPMPGLIQYHRDSMPIN